MYISLAVLFFFLLPGINHGLWRPDEPRVAGTCAEMARTGDYVVPHLNGNPFLEKPPLYYNLAALSGSLLGVDRDVPYRLVSLLFAVLTILVTCAMATGNGGLITGLAAGGILASSWGFFMLSRWIQVDMALVFGVTLAMYSFLRLTDTGKLRYSVMLGLSAGIAFMAKGFVGPALIASAMLADTIRRRDIGLLWKVRPFTITACALAVVLPWACALWGRGGWPFLREVFVVNNLMRFTGAPEGAALGHQDGFLFYFQHFPGAFLPWTLLFIPALALAFRRFKEDPFISWFAGPFVMLLMASTKRGIYLVPLYPAAACMTAYWFVHRARGVGWEDVLVKVTWAFAVVACLVPFAGIFLGSPVLGTVMGMIAVLSLLLLIRWARQPEAFSLVALSCVAVFSLMSVYYACLKPNEDYIQFARNALSSAQGREITLIGYDECMQGILPMLTGRACQVVGSPTGVLKEGVYLWADRDNKIIREVSRHAAVKILFETCMDLKGNRITRLAYIAPGTSKSGGPALADGRSPAAPVPKSSGQGERGW